MKVYITLCLNAVLKVV